MCKIVDYDIITALDITELKNLVKWRISHGWELYGPAALAIDEGTQIFTQTIVRYEVQIIEDTGPGI
ncbi:hypothetical protein AYK24_00010 [Thermoplasmatales archaeon SG8-52-4]|nr:MAG: hypothetical protein AYK24_00010 [Thermoplasmatales archaeon SG8-52-4]